MSLHSASQLRHTDKYISNLIYSYIYVLISIVRLTFVSLSAGNVLEGALRFIRTAISPVINPRENLPAIFTLETDGGVQTINNVRTHIRLNTHQMIQPSKISSVQIFRTNFQSTSACLSLFKILISFLEAFASHVVMNLVACAKTQIRCCLTRARVGWPFPYASFPESSETLFQTVLYSIRTPPTSRNRSVACVCLSKSGAVARARVG